MNDTNLSLICLDKHHQNHCRLFHHRYYEYNNHDRHRCLRHHHHHHHHYDLTLESRVWVAPIKTETHLQPALKWEMLSVREGVNFFSSLF